MPIKHKKSAEWRFFVVLQKHTYFNQINLFCYKIKDFYVIIKKRKGGVYMKKFLAMILISTTLFTSVGTITAFADEPKCALNIIMEGTKGRLIRGTETVDDEIKNEKDFDKWLKGGQGKNLVVYLYNENGECLKRLEFVHSQDSKETKEETSNQGDGAFTKKLFFLIASIKSAKLVLNSGILLADNSDVSVINLLISIMGNYAMYYLYPVFCQRVLLLLTKSDD